MSTRWIHDLGEGAPRDPIETGVCIVGAGPVGIMLACALADLGQRVTILEGGGAAPTQVGEDADVQFDRRAYRGATIGRAVGLGGTSALWGGQLLPVRPEDLLARPQIDALDWPLRYADLAPHFGAVQRLLGIRPAAFDLASSRGPAQQLRSLDFSGWAPRLSQWLAFGRRNLAAALNGRMQRGGVQIWLNAAAGGWQLSGPPGSRQVREITARSPQGHLLRVQPAVTVIAGGALDSARSVLELDAAAGSLAEGVSALTGRFLHDHLSLRLARVNVHDPAGFAERFAPHFDGATMRSLRMELPAGTLESAGLPALYAHFIAETPEGSGFAVARDLLRAAQRRNLREAGAAVRRVPRALPDLTHLIVSRLVRGRLAFPADSRYFLHVDVEQAPRHHNRVYVGQPGSGAGGRLHVDWDVDGAAARIAASARTLFERFWQRNGLDCIATVDFLDLSDESQAWNHNVYDLYHPAGTTRMARDAHAGVVDADLKIHGTANAYVAGASVFPSMGAANPTFTAMALGLRLAAHIDGLRPAA